MALLVIALGLTMGGCATSTWMGGAAKETDVAKPIEWSVTINQHQVTITVPGGAHNILTTAGPRCRGTRWSRRRP